MFIKKWKLLLLYIGRIGLAGRAFDRHSQVFANKNCPQVRSLPGGGMLAAGIDTTELSS